MLMWDFSFERPPNFSTFKWKLEGFLFQVVHDMRVNSGFAFLNLAVAIEGTWVALLFESV